MPRIIYKPGPFTKTGFNKLSFGLGIKGLETDFGTLFYGITAVNFSRIKIISAKSRLSLGVDGFYDPSLVSKLEKMEKKPVAASIAYRMGMNLGYELSAGNITLLVRNGLYVLDQYKEDGIYYIKSGVEYDFTKKLFAAFYLKTHFGKADYFEYAIGYKFL